MATLFWRGGTDTWNATAGSKWSTVSGGPGGAPIPTASDDVVINDVNGGSSTITIGATGAVCRNINFTGFTGTLAGASFANLEIAGSLTLASGMTITNAGNFVMTGAVARNITSAGLTIPTRFLFSGSGSWTLQDDLSVTGSITVQQGTLNTNNKAVTLGPTANFIANSGTLTRALNAGTSTITLSGGEFRAGTLASGFTLANTDWTLRFQLAAGSLGGLLIGGDQYYNNVWVTLGSGSAFQVRGNNSFGTFKADVAGSPGGSRVVSFLTSSTQTVTVWDVNGAALSTILLQPTSGGTWNVVSNGSADIVSQYVSINGSQASGSAAFYAPPPGSSNSGSNSGWLFQAPPRYVNAAQLIPELTQQAAIGVPEASINVSQTIPPVSQTVTMLNFTDRLVTAAQAIPAPVQIATAEVEARIAQNSLIPPVAQAVTIFREAVLGAAQTIPAPANFAFMSVEAMISASQQIPALQQSAQLVEESGLFALQMIPAVATLSSMEVENSIGADQLVPPMLPDIFIGHQSLLGADQQIPAVRTQAQFIVTWQPIIPYGFGSRLLYHKGSPLEKTMADIDVDRIIQINAELIIENWDPFAVQTRNIPFLAYGMGVTLWEDNYWNEDTKRRWMARQWEYKGLRGTVAGLRMALGTSGYELVDYVAPPQGFYASPNLPPEDFNRWVRLMPELRFTYGKKRGVAFDYEWFVDDAFAGQSMVGLADGYALRGRYAFLRQNGVVTPLDIIEYHPAREERQGISYERVSVPGLSTEGIFVGETAAGEDNFAGFAEKDPRLYTVRLDHTFSIDVTQVHLSILTPELEPLTPHHEVNSDIGDGNSWFFVGDFIDDFRFVDWEDGGARLLAQRMYLLDPAVSAPMSQGISFVGDRVNMPVYTAYLQIDLHTTEQLPTIFAEDMFVGVNYAGKEDPSHVDRACRSVVDAKALRDTMLISFAPYRLVAMGDYLTDSTVPITYIRDKL